MNQTRAVVKAARDGCALAIYFLLIVATRAGVRWCGFANTFRIIRRLRPASDTCTIDAAGAAKAADLIATAAAFYPGRARCLEQSMVLYLVLRRRGAPAALRIGVQPYGFLAHAWVELDGRPVNELGETIRALVAFPTIGI